MSRAERKRTFLKQVLSETALNGVIPAITVGAVMTPRPFTVNADCPAPQLVQLFHEKQFRHFLVTDGGQLAGIISDRDVIPLFGNSSASQNDLEKVAAADVMSTDVITVGRSTSLADAIEQMVNAGINSLPVVDGGEVVGILTSTDLFLTLEQLLLAAIPAQEAIS